MNQPNTWDLTYFYKDKESFELDLKKFEELSEKTAAFEGKLSEEENLVAYLRQEVEANVLLSRLYHYASMQSDQDKKNVESSTLLSRVRIALNQYLAKASFAEPEMLALGKERMDQILAKHPEIAEFSFIFEKLFRGQSHVLSADKEALISNFRPTLSQPSTLYAMLDIADYSPKEITLSTGEKVAVSKANWTSLIAASSSPADRKAIFEALYSGYDSHKHTYAEIYNGVLQSQLAIMKSRGYQSILESHLFDNAISEDVFLNLIDVASKNAEPLKKYLRLRKEYLGLEEYHTYDRFLELAHSDKQYSYEEAKQIFFDSIASFPQDFQDKAHEVLREGFVDVYPGDGKRSGAYSTGGENIHPFILLNFIGELNDVFTLAHESGHSIHTMYSEEFQPIMKQDYTIFVAEIASTFNEHNLLDYFLTKGELSKNDKIALLQKEIDEIASTFYRQTLFAHFEYLAAKKVEAGEPINHEVLNKIMIDLYETYYGLDITKEIYKPMVWAYIPHLYNSPFYVYQYATSFTSSMLIYDNVKRKVPGAFDRYIDLLRSGGSNFPVEQVKEAGVDLTSKEPFEVVVKRMGELVDQLELLLKE